MAHSESILESGPNQTGRNEPGRLPSNSGTTAAASEEPIATTDSPTTCPECNGTLTVSDSEQHCQDCGLITDVDDVDRGPEWRAAASRSDETGHNLRRCNGMGRTETLHDHGLGSVFDASAEQADPDHSRKQKLNRQAKFESKRDRNLGHGFSEIRRMTSDISVGTSIEERACRLYRRAQQADLLVGRSIELVASGCVYAACREQSIPRLPGDVAETMRLTDEEAPGDGTAERALQQVYGTLCRELGLNIMPLTPADHISRITSQVDVHDATHVEAMRLAQLTEELQSFVGRSPSGVAAAVVWLASNRTEAGITQHEVADAIDVATVTLRENADLLKNAEADEQAEAGGQDEHGDEADVQDKPSGSLDECDSGAGDLEDEGDARGNIRPRPATADPAGEPARPGPSALMASGNGPSSSPSPSAAAGARFAGGAGRVTVSGVEGGYGPAQAPMRPQPPPEQGA